jgi:hypothetical protein
VSIGRSNYAGKPGTSHQILSVEDTSVVSRMGLFAHFLTSQRSFQFHLFSPHYEPIIRQIRDNGFRVA